MDCKDIDKLLTVYLEGVASPEEEEQVKAHLATCPSCREELEIRRKSREQLGKALKLASSRVALPTGSWESIAEQAGTTSKDEKQIRKKLSMSWLAVPLSIFLLVVLVGSFIPMLGGMSPPPPPAPTMASDESGGAFLVWLDNPWLPDNTVRTQHIDGQGKLLWGEEGEQIAFGTFAMPYAVGDDNGGILIVWEDNDYQNITKLSSDGTTVWKLENFTTRSMLGIIKDGSGGAILALSDSGDRICVQRVSSDGILLWGEGGAFIGTTTDDYSNVSIAEDGLNGAVVVWHELNDSDVTIRAQLLSSEGKNLWVSSGVAVTSMTDAQGSNNYVIADDMGNFFIAWDTGSATFDTDVYIQKLDKDGNPVWDDGGMLACQDQADESLSPANMQSQPLIVVDGTGGVIVTWHDRRRIKNREIFAQRFSADGEMLWDENGVWVWDIPEDYIGTTSGILSSSITSDGDGGAVVVWTGYGDSYSGNSVIYAQRLNRDGQRMWPGEQVYIDSPFQSQGYAGIVCDEDGGVIIGSRVGESSSVSQTDSIYAQRIGADGNRVWGKEGVQVYKVRSALTVQFIALGTILLSIIVLIGVFRRNRAAGVFTAILPALLGVAGLFSVLLVIGPFGYSYSWAYIPDTAVNKLAAAIVPIIGLAIAAVGIWKKTAPKWVMIPIVCFSSLVAIIAGLILIF
jgi:hypothetical protein